MTTIRQPITRLNFHLSIVGFCLVGFLVMGALQVLVPLAARIIDNTILWVVRRPAARTGKWRSLDDVEKNLQRASHGVAFMLLPGVLLSMFLWFTVHMMFQRSGVGGALLALKAREPNQNELKELQLADVAQEMAIASGLPAPKLMLIDSLGANAAAIGTSPADARIVISRRLIDDLSRDEMEGVLANLIASIGNGDLHIAFRMTAVFETCGLLVAVINSPFGPKSRRLLWRLLSSSLSRSSGDAAVQETAEVAELLARNVDPESDDIDQFFDPNRKKSKLRAIRNFIFFPIVFSNFAIKLSLWFFSAAALGPSMALLWHTRRFLADATAVQLTRNPDGLASALQKLTHEPGEIPGGDWASHLFFVKPTPASGNAPDARQRQLLSQAWAATQSSAAANATTPANVDFTTLQTQFADTLRAAVAGDAQARGRIRAMYQSVATADPALAAQFPNPDDFFSARQGGVSALRRLQALRNASAPQTASAQKQNSPAGSRSTSLVSFMAFHPSIERRLKRLARMGAHPDLEPADRKGWIVMFVIGLIFSPFFIAIVAGLLILIAIMTLSSITFLLVWMAFIHKAFTLLPHAKA